ncbi:TPA: hypothetical protein N0F65_007415 [Lagenidium giganteum]|uniref:Uncharacterized protein n=1 Tax=Lagenidium giganteum TaxID=4803 RepID=A0AAV2ZM02_9STRA|nr:TPA: hypothetical protein N0F65_007415 [Lagenidium giganteum]
MTLAVRAMMIWMVLVAVATSQPTDSVQELRMAAPNIAGMLFPDNSQRVVFGTSPLSTLLSTSYTTLPTLSSCPDAFCLNIVTTSTFVLDPLVLDRYEALYPVNSQTFDPLSPNMVRPMLQGSADGSAKTLWQFSTTDPVNRPISLLLVFKQQSQRASRKDQLLIHITANPTSENSVATTVEIFNRYGNQQVRHKVTLIDKQTFQIALTITMNSAAFDAVISNSNPPVLARTTPVTPISWTYAAGPCLDCTARLFECTVQQVNTNQCNFETSNATLIECLRTTAGLNHVAFSQMLSGDVGSTTSLKSPLSTCFTAMMLQAMSNQDSAYDHITSQFNVTSVIQTCAPHLSLASWKAILAFMSCYGQHKCPINTPASSSVATYVNVIAGQQILLVPTGDQISVTITPPTNTDLTNNQAFVGTVDELRSLLQNTILEGASVVNVAASELVPGKTRLAIDYVQYGGSLPDIAGAGVTTVSSVLPQLLFQGSSRKVFWDSLQASLMSAISAASARKQQCASCVNMNLAGGQLSSFLPAFVSNLTQSQGVTTINQGTGVDFSSVIETVTHGLTVATWRPFGRYLICLMMNGCLVSALDIPGLTQETFVILEDPYEFITASVESVVTISGSSAWGSQLTVQSSTAVLDNSTGYGEFKQALQTFINQVEIGGGIVDVSEMPYDGADGTKKLKVMYRDYYGTMPVLSGNDLVSISRTPARSYFQALGGSPSWTQLSDQLSAFVSSQGWQQPTPTPSPAPVSPAVTRVLSGNCASCGLGLYECTLDSVGSGACSFSSTTSLFMACLSGQLPASKFSQLLSGGLVIPYDVHDVLATCFSAVEEVDSSSGASIEEMNWYKASEGLACFEGLKCPFGPLGSAIANSEMAVITSTATTMAWWITSDHFTAQFVIIVAGGEKTTDAFTDLTDKNDIAALVAAKLPTSVEFTVNVILFPAQNAVEVDITCRYLYAPDFQMYMLIDGERKSSVATTRGEFKLDVIALDSSTVQTLSVPAPATPAPVVPASNTPPPVVPEPDTPAPVAPAPDTPAPVAPSPDTPAPVAPAPDTPIPVAPTPDTPAPVAPAPDTPPPVVPEPDTPAPVAPTPDTPAPVAPSPDTPAPVAPAPDTPVPVAPTPDTPAPDTPAPVAPAPDTPAPVTPSVTRVLSGSCASCGLALYECIAETLASGACSYLSANAATVSCLARELPATTFTQLLSGALGAPYDVLSALTTCFSEVEDTDVSSGLGMEETNWYKASEGLACFEGFKCPFGPLDSSIANNEMVVIKSTATVMKWWITSDHFTAKFAISVAGFDIETDPFTDLTDKNDIVALVAVKLPPSVEFTVNVIPFPAQNAVEVDITCHYLYAADLEIYMVIDGALKSPVDSTLGGFSLDVMALDTSAVVM